MATTRINKDAALLLRSRVALFEGTWLKSFEGTAFVPMVKDGRVHPKIIIKTISLNPDP